MRFKYLAFFAINWLSGLSFAHIEDLVNSVDAASVKPAPGPSSSNVGKPLWVLSAVPFVGSPVHEKLTIRSINLSQVHGREFRVEYDDAYIKGVFWNDDPLELLCPSCSAINPLKFQKVWGITFGLRFNEAKKRAVGDGTAAGYFFRAGDGLFERSHFGDLQFLHAMATQDGETAAETQSMILVWSEFAYKVATGEIDQRLRIDQIPIERVRQWLAPEPTLKDKRIYDMFRGPNMAPQVAIGSILHVVQDSFAAGHVERTEVRRVTEDGQPVFARGTVRSFHSYVHQDTALHRLDDQWPEEIDHIALVDSDNPVSVGAQLLRMVYANKGRGAPWPEVETYLRSTVFKLEDPKVPAGPGDKYRVKKL